MLAVLSKRPNGLTEIRRDGKDNDAVIRVIKKELERCEQNGMSGEDLRTHMETFSSACWVSIKRISAAIVQLILKNNPLPKYCSKTINLCFPVHYGIPSSSNAR